MVAIIRLLYLSFALSVLAGVACPQGETTDRDVGLSDADFTALRDRIRARESELSWAELPWLTSYHAGLQKAAEEVRPLLLWVMNGHPLGCT